MGPVVHNGRATFEEDVDLGTEAAEELLDEPTTGPSS